MGEGGCVTDTWTPSIPACGGAVTDRRQGDHGPCPSSVISSRYRQDRQGVTMAFERWQAFVDVELRHREARKAGGHTCGSWSRDTDAVREERPQSETESGGHEVDSDTGAVRTAESDTRTVLYRFLGR